MGYCSVGHPSMLRMLKSGPGTREKSSASQRFRLIPAVIAARLFASCGDAPASAPVFQSVRRPGSPLTERAVNFIVKEAAERAAVTAQHRSIGAPCSCVARHRQWGALDAGISHLGARRPENTTPLHLAYLRDHRNCRRPAIDPLTDAVPLSERYKAQYLSLE